MVVRFATDENVRTPILEGFRTRRPDVDIVRVQDVGMRRAEDPAILGWAASEGRVLLTHDVQTMTGHAYHRVAAGLPMPGLVVIPFKRPIGQAIEDLVLAVEASLDSD